MAADVNKPQAYLLHIHAIFCQLTWAEVEPTYYTVCVVQYVFLSQCVCHVPNTVHKYDFCDNTAVHAVAAYL